MQDQATVEAPLYPWDRERRKTKEVVSTNVRLVPGSDNFLITVPIN